jgi:hypothetical protein
MFARRIIPQPARALIAALTLAFLLPFPTRALDTKNAPAKPFEPVKLQFETAGYDSSPTNVLKLKGAEARRQVLLTAADATGSLRDLTAAVAIEAKPAGIVRIDHGLIIPLSDGAVTLRAKTANGISAELAVHVENAKDEAPINFANQIVPVFTKGGCNGGGCHGKASGQNGFKLSLLGFEPADDYDYLVKEARGRRLFPASPERSLLLLKGVATLPHGGGKRLETDSDDYRLLVRWISQGMPYGNPTDPKVERIEVFPKERVLPMSGQQQLAVLARYTDGSVLDVTRSALYEPNDKNIAKADGNGLVTVFDQPGDVGVMVRYQGKVAVFRAMLPLGAPVENLPEPRNFIDTLVFAKLKKMGLPPSGECDDATFVRRVSLDIAGRLPTPDEAKKFIENKEPNKRDALIDSLLASTDYADFFANKWSSLLRNKRNDDKYKRGTFAFHSWIRDSLAENKPYDEFVREIVSASGDMTENPPVAWFRQVNNSSAQLEDTAQLFLGTRLQCAQCHHHPYEKWSQDDYYSFAAVFKQTARKPGAQPGEEVVFHRRGNASATNKKTNKPVGPAVLGTSFKDATPDEDPRELLADWMSQPGNPFFAKSLANRYWKHFFNRGLVEPEDDMRETNPPTNPELLDALAKHFVESRFDMKALIRVMCQSRVYQLSAVPNDYNGVDKIAYSRYFAKRLSAEPLYDAVNSLLNTESKFEGVPVGTKAVQLPDNSFNASSYFLSVFGRPDASSSCECERSQDASLAQALHLLNSKDLQEKLVSDAGRPAGLASDPAPDDEKIRNLYLLALAREATSDEVHTAKMHLEKKVASAEKGKEPAAKRAAYEDIVWALLNTKEFLFNH